MGILKRSYSFDARKMKAGELTKIIEAPVENVSSQTFILKPKMELRFEVEMKGEIITLELISGLAEIFGAEITTFKKYEFRYGEKIAVFTWHGCKVKISGKAESFYAYTNKEETPMDIYLNCFGAVGKTREFAITEGSRGPIIMVAGSSSVGKSSLCKILLNYGVRLGRKPIFVDLNVDQAGIGLPGSVGALHVKRPADVNKGFQDNPSGPPLLLHFGHTSPNCNTELFNHIVQKLARGCYMKLKVDQDANISGIIINTCGWSNGDPIDGLICTALNFKVDVICVLSNDKLTALLEQKLPDDIKILNLPKSSGVVRKSEEEREALANLSIQNYFYGQKRLFHPYRIELKWNQIRIFEFKSSKQSLKKYPDLIVVLPSRKLCNNLLNISFAKSLEDKDSLLNIAGFVCVTEVDEINEIIVILSPDAEPFSDNILLWNRVIYVD